MGQSHSSSSNAAPASQPPASTSSTSASHVNVEMGKDRAENDSSHNFGQPRHPLQKAVSPEGKTGASKHVTDCRQQQRESLRCIEENYINKDKVCVPFFEAYKKCRREEHERKLEKNRKDSEKFWS